MDVKPHVSCQSGHLHQSSGTTTRTTSFIRQSHTDRNQLQLATANTGETLEKFWRKKCRWMDLKDRNYPKEEILAVDEACRGIFWPTPGFKVIIFQLWVLNRWVFNFCVRCTPVRGCVCLTLRSLCGAISERKRAWRILHTRRQRNANTKTH